ncbi:GntR family transcriptional regulator [Bosea caraganae]|uniref:GntR family transcriptional regulator n=1 Tax=Bosea caraganae TaxID=2763117 RepID=A0A370L292_9HYPH|nr:GntR family transcriptional regulator [Bosea caraganae]RDJ22257.1 GntR family transcriptional regulator [Bosea caraganae]RDJ22656.1 GntR family transcriptional regulator [Bosea caraganae]
MPHSNSSLPRPRPGVIRPEEWTETDAAPKESLVEEAYRALKASILEGVLPPGYQAVEQRIAEQLNMSRTPVHEAIIRLQQEGLLRVLPRRGVQVLPLSAADMLETYQLLIALEGMAALLLADRTDDPRATEAVIDSMAAATDQMERCFVTGDLRGWAKADDQFHRLLVGECGNARLAKMASTMTDQAQRAREATLRYRPSLPDSVIEHRRILAALRAGAGAEARSAAETHRTRASAEIVAALK